MSARIVLITAGSFGDLFPTLALALALKSRGHRPVVATSPAYRLMVEGDGLEFHPVRPDMDPSDTALLRRVMDPVKGSEIVVRELAIPSLRESFADLMAILPGADLAVTHPITFAAPLAAGKLGVPWVSTVLAPLSFFSVFDFPVLPTMPAAARLSRLGPWAARPMRALAKAMTDSWMNPVKALRAEQGLPPAGHPLFEGQFSPFANLALFSRVLADPQSDWPAGTTVTGFLAYPDRQAVTPELAAFLDAGAPPIVFTLGSTAVGAAGNFYEAGARAAAALGRRAVLLIGKHPENRQATLPPGVIAVEYAPHQALFARAAAVVHHGGVGTTGHALACGHPMLVVPWSHDQPDNAARVEKLGVARVLYPKRYNTATLSVALRALLENPSYAQRAETVGRSVRAEDGAGVACAVLERVLAGAASVRARGASAPGHPGT